MNTLKYYSIGSHPNNDLQISAVPCAAFHLLLYKNDSAQVVVCTRMYQASFIVNGSSKNELYTLRPDDQLFIGTQMIDWMPIFAITAAQITQHQTSEAKIVKEQKGLRVQLVLIYLVVIAMLFLMAFYI